MADHQTHQNVEMLAGGSYACFRARAEDPTGALWETLGGVLGGWLGATLPDGIDPPSSPQHRSLGHGVIPAGAAGMWVLSQLTPWQEALRARAEAHALARCELWSSEEVGWHEVMEIVCRIGSGMLAGMWAGYASHLLLDAATAPGLPPIM